jgi:hypothetical protein
MHNEEVYEEPDRFMPERYLTSSPPPDPESYAFGFGRRYVNQIYALLFGPNTALYVLGFARVSMLHNSQCGFPSGAILLLRIISLLADYSVSNTLANFDISKAKDENGLEITPNEHYTTGIIRLVQHCWCMVSTLIVEVHF